MNCNANPTCPILVPELTHAALAHIPIAKLLNSVKNLPRRVAAFIATKDHGNSIIMHLGFGIRSNKLIYM